MLVPSKPMSKRCFSSSSRLLASRSASSVKPRIRKGYTPPSAPVNKANLLDAVVALKALNPTNVPWGAYELEIHTNPNPMQQANALRGRLFPPFQVYSSRKRDIIVVFAEGDAAKAARDAGADVVGGAELVPRLLENELQPSKVIAHPNMLQTVNAQLGRFLGPKGLMPSVRRGTVTEDLAKAVQEARGGLDWKADADGIVRTCIGRLHLAPEAVIQNVKLLLDEVADLAAGSAGQPASLIAEKSFGQTGSVNPEQQKRAAIKRVLLTSTQGSSFVLENPLA